MTGAYTIAAILAPVAVIGMELLAFRTGMFRERRYWITLAIALGFQIPVDGWLTRSGNPIVMYSDDAISGVRFPFNIPVEDFGFGFALVTLTLSIWRYLTWRLHQYRGDAQQS